MNQILTNSYENNYPKHQSDELKKYLAQKYFQGRTAEDVNQMA